MIPQVSDVQDIPLPDDVIGAGDTVTRSVADKPNRQWEARNPERYRAWRREYMRQYRQQRMPEEL